MPASSASVAKDVVIVQIDDAVAVQVGQLGCRLGRQPRAQLLNHTVPPQELILAANNACQAEHHGQCPVLGRGHAAPSPSVQDITNCCLEAADLTVQCTVLGRHNSHQDGMPLRSLLSDMMQCLADGTSRATPEIL